MDFWYNVFQMYFLVRDALVTVYPLLTVLLNGLLSMKRDKQFLKAVSEFAQNEHSDKLHICITDGDTHYEVNLE